MMYNVARALALIGLVGVSANNQTNTTSSGSTAPPQSGGCTEWDKAIGAGVLFGRRALAADQRRLVSHNTTSNNCPTDVPKCLYLFAEFTGLESTLTGNASCPTSYTAAEGTWLKDVVKKAVCTTTDTDGCYAAIAGNLNFKLKCKTTAGGSYPTTAVSPATTRRRLATGVTMHMVAAVNVDGAKNTGAFTAQKAVGALYAVSVAANSKDKVGTALKAGFNSATALTAASVFSNHAAANIAVSTAGISVTNLDCSDLIKLSDYKAACTQANSQAAKCTNFTGPANPNAPSNAVSFILSAAVLAVAAFI